MKYAWMLAALTVLALATPAAAQSDDLFLLCTRTGGDPTFENIKVVHVDVSFATQLVSLTPDNSSKRRFQNGLAEGSRVTFANTSQSEITFGLDDTETYAIDRTTGQMNWTYHSKLWGSFSCERETVATKF